MTILSQFLKVKYFHYESQVDNQFLGPKLKLKSTLLYLLLQ